MNFLTDISSFTPHGFCLAWQPGLIWLMAASDLLIAGAYFSIPAALLLFLLRRRDLTFKPVFALFATFITACGATHVIGAVTLWVPVYWLDGIVNGITAALSVTTAIMLWPLVPKAVALPSPDNLRELNAALAKQVVQRDKAVAMLNVSQNRLRQLYARSPAILHATDAYGILVEVSDRWLDLAGRTRAEVIGKRIQEFYTTEDAQACSRQLTEFRAGRGARQAERRLVRGDGQLRDIEVAIELEYDADGTLQGAFASLTDVTARKIAEQALRHSEEQLRQAQKMKAVGQLTGGIAHDFNNLLTTVMGSLELLAERPSIDGRGQHLIANAMSGSRRAARLTSQLLTFSRRQILNPESLAPQSIVEGIHDLLTRTLGERIVLEVTRSRASQWPLLADRNQVEAALLNLVINARDAIDGAGRVSIGFGNVPVREAEPDGLAAGDYCLIRVADDGAGMSEETRARVFEPFFTTKAPGSGTGLGLSQIYGFVTQSNGAIRIESEPGIGTVVSLLLPRAVRAPVAAPPEPERSAPAGSGERILVVEDDVLLRETMADALEQRHYTVITAPDGLAALGILETDIDIALLFTDVMMPGTLTGVELAAAAKALRPTLPVLFATGYSDGLMFTDWNEPLDLLPKPYSVDLLATRVAQKLNDARAQAPNPLPVAKSPKNRQPPALIPSRADL